MVVPDAGLRHEADVLAGLLEGHRGGAAQAEVPTSAGALDAQDPLPAARGGDPQQQPNDAAALVGQGVRTDRLGSLVASVDLAEAVAKRCNRALNSQASPKAIN